MTSRSRCLEDRPSVTTPSTTSPRRFFRVLPAQVGLSLFAGLLVGLTASPAFSQGRLDAQYQATLAGIPVGKGAWTIEISDDQFSASAIGGTAGLLKAFTAGSG